MTHYFEDPFAVVGDKTAIPTTIQGGGEVSYPEGYSADYEADQAIDPDAKDVPRQTENQFKFDVTELLKEIQESGFLPYRADINYSPVPSFAVGSNGTVYISTAINGPDTAVVDPVGDTTGVWLNAFITGVKTTVLTASDPAWIPDPLAKSIEFVAIGGGGGGGGVDGQGAGTSATASGGGGGGSCTLTKNEVAASYALVIGAGGNGGIAGNNSGATGGTTTVIGTGVNLSAGGGAGGAGDTGTAASGVSAGSEGGLATGGDINVKGEPSGIGSVVNGEIASVPVSGSSSLGGGIRPRIGSSAGASSVLGEGGGACSVTDSATNYAGSKGGSGVVIIKEYI